MGVRRGDPDFDGSVVALGALGLVTRLTVDVQPTYRMRQDAYTDLVAVWVTAIPAMPGRRRDHTLAEVVQRAVRQRRLTPPTPAPPT